MTDTLMFHPNIMVQARGCSCLDMGLDAEVVYKGVVDAVMDGTAKLS